ncbi:MAG: hypothetical protein HQ477_13660 [Chloroflexi bacterium]|nr:hypothetical protein [Chloroflexota bacterium]
MKQGIRIPLLISSFVRQQAARNPRPTNVQIRSGVLERFGEDISDRTIGRICRADQLATRSVDAGKQVSDQDRRRLSRLLDAMWIPDPRDVTNPWEGPRKGLSAVSISGKELVWRTMLIADGRGRQRSAIERCWHTGGDETWLIRDLFKRLPSPQRTRLIGEYESLQERACRIIGGIRDWNSSRHFSDNRPTIVDYADLRDSGTSFSRSNELASEALFLIDEAPLLRGAIAEFVRDSLTAAGA